MPWITDRNTGEKRYQVSLYTKEELPTWSEVYNDWFLGKCYVYNPIDSLQQDVDPYWNIPRIKYLQAVVCNQFNKTLFEDNKRNDILNYLNSDGIRSMINMEVTDVRFILENINDTIFKGSIDLNSYNRYLNEIIERYTIKEKCETPPPIYTIPLPSGKRNIFITNDHPRTNINDLDSALSVTPIILMKLLSYDCDEYLIYNCRITYECPEHPEIAELKRDLWIKIIIFMMRQYVDYFKDPVGWKDEKGNLIEFDETQKLKCSGVGYDPAL